MPIFLSTEARERLLTQAAAKTRQRAEREGFLDEIEEAASRARCWARAQEQLTGKVPDITEMPPDYSLADFMRDRLCRLDHEDADIRDAVDVAYDCWQAGAECLSPREKQFIISLTGFDSFSGKQKRWLQHCLRKIDLWLIETASCEERKDGGPPRLLASRPTRNQCTKRAPVSNQNTRRSSGGELRRAS